MTMTIDRLLAEARSQVLARLDAELLLGHVLARPRSFLAAWPAFEPDARAVSRFETLLARRKRGEPLAYILGQREFWSLDIKVSRDTLIPRPETELLVEQALARLPANARATIADVGTGSGAIALAIASERPRCRVIATDDSAPALALARSNAARLQLGNIEFRTGPWLMPLARNDCDLIVSNPPYIAAHDPHLDAPALQFEPRGALVAGPTGLEALKTLVANAPTCLVEGGVLLLEHGWNQGEAVASALSRSGYVKIERYTDLAGHERMTSATWPEAPVTL